MTPTMQTIFGNGKQTGVPGNCIQACVATIFDLPLDAVPNFLIFGSQWEHAFILWLKSKDHEKSRYVAEWLKEDQVNLNGVPEGEYVMASGMAARGLMHACVFQKKDNWFVPVHDPHPDKTFYGDNEIRLITRFFPLEGDQDG